MHMVQIDLQLKVYEQILILGQNWPGPYAGIKYEHYVRVKGHM